MPKQLTFTKTQKGKQFLYQVFENDKVIAQRTSGRNYVAFLIEKEGTVINIRFAFGRMQLIGKGGSKHVYQEQKYYAIAVLDK